jgi:hypothetical protein
LESSWRATSSYVLITLVMTWPLAAGMTQDVPGDLGDSLLNMWILGWGAEHLPRLLTGQLSLGEFWNANVFHPEPLVLSLSEHLFGQVLQILPVYHLTGNLILCYNLLFLSSFVLSGLGMYLLVRDLTGNPHAAFIAGVIYAFVPFRIAQVAHIQSVSSQWMPLALYGFRRFLTTDRYRALAGGTAALLMQNWSCGYYMVFFAPFVVLFVAHQVCAAGRARDWRVWLAFVVAGLLVTAGTAPFLWLYLEGQRVHGLERPIGEVIRFSADVFSYVTAPEALRLWGNVLQAYVKPEGELFVGAIPLLLTLVAIVWSGGAFGAWHRPRALTFVLAALILIQTMGLIAILLTGGFITSAIGIPIRANNPSRIAIGIALCAGALLIFSARARAFARKAIASPLTLAIMLTVLAMWMSLGPLPQSRGQSLRGFGLYAFFYDHVPGFAGLRVPARYAMVAAVFLSIAAGYGAAAILERVKRRTVIAAAISALFLIEAAFVPMLVNQTWGEGGVAPPPRVEPATQAPAVYRVLATMPAAAVLIEFPFGDPAWELRYVYYSTVHWKRLVNGYSGAFPQPYKVRVARLQQLGEDPAGAWQTLRDAGTTHAIVHEAAFAAGEADIVKRWLASHGATEVGRFESDVLYALP